MFLRIAIYCFLEGVSEFVSGDLKISLYSVSSQAPKSISLHRREQKGKYFELPEGALTGLPQIGHLCFIAAL